MSAVDIKSAVEELKEKGRAAKAASKQMAKLPTEVKNKALHNIADGLLSNQEKILAANEIDCKGAKVAGLSEAIIGLVSSKSYWSNTDIVTFTSGKI